MITVILLYGLSILMLMASYIRKNKSDRKLNKTLKEMAYVRKREALYMTERATHKLRQFQKSRKPGSRLNCARRASEANTPSALLERRYGNQLMLPGSCNTLWTQVPIDADVHSADVTPDFASKHDDSVFFASDVTDVTLASACVTSPREHLRRSYSDVGPAATCDAQRKRLLFRASRGSCVTSSQHNDVMTDANRDMHASRSSTVEFTISPRGSFTEDATSSVPVSYTGATVQHV